MLIKTSLQYVALLTAILGMADAARADNCSGYDVLALQSAETYELAKGHTLTLVRLHSTNLSDSTTSPYHLTTGECSGAVLTTPDGITRASGFCVRKDKSGDGYNVQWELPPGSQKFNWKHVGGTGKFAGTSDAGSAQGLELAAGAKMSVNRWSGVCK